MNTIGNLVLALGSTAVALLLLEIVVRVLDVAPRPLEPLPIPTFRVSENAVITYEYRPGYKPTDAPFAVPHRGFAINSAGFRDHEYDDAKPEGVYRIVVLGDSTTAGIKIQDLDKTYTKQLEKLLNSDTNASIHYEVLNLGVGGYHTLQEIETLRVKGLKYNPDLVLVTFCLNDFDMHADGGVYDRLREKNKSLQDVYRTLQSSVLRLSRLAFISYHRLNTSKTTHDEWYLKHVLKGQSTVRAGFVLLSELQQKHGFSALVLILPEFRAPFHAYRSNHIHEKVFRAAEGLPGIVVIDLLEGFARMDNDATKFSHDRLHMNEYGHRAMAQILLPIVRASVSGQPALGPVPVD